MKHVLQFSNPVFHGGLNVTVRNGDKWMKANIGDHLEIKETGSPVVRLTGTLIGKACLPFTMVPDAWLIDEHDPSCRTYVGLLKEMERVYPEFSAENNTVTVLLFTL